MEWAFGAGHLCEYGIAPRYSSRGSTAALQSECRPFAAADKTNW